MGQITITPNDFRRISERFEQHRQAISEIVKSINSDMDILFPAFNCSNSEKDMLKNTTANLNECSNTLHSFSELLEKAADVCEIPKDSLNLASFF